MKLQDVREKYKLPHGSARNPDTVNTIVLHWTAGSSAASSLEWLSKLPVGRRASYHYVIERDGSVLKAVATQQIAWHVGMDQWLPPIRSVGPNGPGTVNATSIGISFALRGTGNETLPTAAQCRAAWELAEGLTKTFPLLWVTTHHECAPRARPDELARFDLETFAASLGLDAWRRRK